MATIQLATSPKMRSRGSSDTMSHTTSRSGSCINSRSSGRSSRSGCSSGSSSFVLRPFGFDSQTSYDAVGNLIKTRSASWLLRVPEKQFNIWKMPPPDFRPQCYAPKPPARNSRDSMQPWRYGTLPGDKKPVTRHSAPAMLPAMLKQTVEKTKEFDTTHNIPDSWEAKLICAKELLFKPEEYRMPKPHDFRGYPPIQSLGLPEFIVDEEHDPFNLKFKADRLDVLPGDGPAFREDRDIKGIQMAPPLPLKLHWDRKLILDSLAFPNKYAAYTRHRRTDRSVHSALMERVEERLNAEWARKQLDKTLQKHRHVTAPHSWGENIGETLPEDEGVEQGEELSMDDQYS